MGSGGTLRTFNTSTLNCFGAITAKSDSVLCFQVITDITLNKYLLFTEYNVYSISKHVCTMYTYEIQYTCATIGYKYELLQWAQCGASFSTIEMGSVTLLKEPCIFSIVQNVGAHLNKQSDFFNLTHPLPDSVLIISHYGPWAKC